MLTVVGGIGNVAGALDGGILAGTAFQALTTTFANLSTTPAAAASGAYGQPLPGGTRTDRGEPRPQPQRSCPHIVARYKPLWHAKGVLVLGVLAEVVAYLLVLTKVMGNWWLVLATALIALAMPAVGRLVEPEAFVNPAQARPARESGAGAEPAPARPNRSSKGWPMPVLEVSEVCVAFGGAQVLSDVSLELSPKEA